MNARITSPPPGASNGAVTSAGLVLAGPFGCFAVVEAGQPGGVYRDILTSLAIGLLMDAFLVRTLTADPQTPPDQDLAAALCQP